MKHDVLQIITDTTQKHDVLQIITDTDTET